MCDRNVTWKQVYEFIQSDEAEFVWGLERSAQDGGKAILVMRESALIWIE